MRRGNFAIPVKLWALACTIIGISLTADTVLTCVLTVTGFAIWEHSATGGCCAPWQFFMRCLGFCCT